MANNSDFPWKRIEWYNGRTRGSHNNEVTNVPSSYEITSSPGFVRELKDKSVDIFCPRGEGLKFDSWVFEE